MSRYDAENIVQDVFLYLLKNPALAGTLLSVQAFLFTMTKNRCIDFLREQSNKVAIKQDIDELKEKEWELKLYALQQLDENLISAEELETVVRKAIDSLPERCRQIFILSRLECLKHKQIAEKLNISTNTVEGQIQIALKKLRVELHDYAFLFILTLMGAVK
jgi:RNA polymerase sigma-70 factor (ECF subfamily)